MLAARACGKGPWRITFDHILPNILSVLTVQVTIRFAIAILAEAALSYLGLGTQPPQPSWGRMLAEAQTLLFQAPRLAVFPGLTIALAVLGLPTRLGAPVGTLNLYCERPRAWDASEVAALEAYTGLLEARLGHAVLAREHSKIVDQLQFALDSRVTIERAVGLLMGRDEVDNMTAFHALRREARSSRRRVLTIAEELLAAHGPLVEADGEPAAG